MGIAPFRLPPAIREKFVDVKSSGSVPSDSDAPPPMTNSNASGEDEKQKLVPQTTQFCFFTPRLDTPIFADSLAALQSFYYPFDTLVETGSHSGVWWLDVSAPSDEDIETLSRIFDIHPLTTEDIKIRESREKIELFGPYSFLSLRPPQQIHMQDETRTSPLNVYAIVFREGVISFNLGNSPHPAHVRNRIKEHQSHLSLTSDWICYALIDDIVDGFAPFISRVETGVEMMEDGVSITRPDDIGLALQRIYACRREVMQIRQLLNDKTDVVRCFARHCDAFGSATAEVTLYLSDIQDHVLTMMGNLAHAEQMLSRSQSKYLSRLSFDSTRMRNQMTATLSRLAVIGAIIVPMQYITNIFGMNVKVPGNTVEGREHESLAWWLGILGVILGLICTACAFAKKYHII